MADDATPEYNEIPEADRKKAKAFFDRGNTVAATGNYDYAIEMYLSGLAIDPDAVDPAAPAGTAAAGMDSSGTKLIGSDTGVDADVAEQGRARGRFGRTARRNDAAAFDQNPSWWVPVMLGLMVLGLIWLVVYYLSNFAWPIKSIGAWNMGIGFALIMIGFAMTTRWK